MYELSRNRYKELKHFCLQYPEMKRELERIEGSLYLDVFDPTGEIAVRATEYRKAMNLIETTAFNIGNFPGEKILKIVSENRCVGEVCPSDKETAKYYIRKFFWMLSKVKGL